MTAPHHTYDAHEGQNKAELLHARCLALFRSLSVRFAALLVAFLLEHTNTRRSTASCARRTKSVELKYIYPQLTFVKGKKPKGTTNHRKPMLGRIKSRIRRVGSDETRSNSSTSSRRGPSPTFFMETSPLGYNAKLTDLSSFDSCVEACDALAASSSYAQSSVKRDSETGMKDCSVLVSPDGDLLLIPQERRTAVQEDERESQSPETPQNGTSTAQVDRGPSQSPYANFLANRQESDDYNSAVIMGYDLQSKGDHALNGFSATGWSAAATSLSIRQSEMSLREMTSFMEALITSKKEHAARASQACDHLRNISDNHGIAPPLPVPVALMNSTTNGSNRKWSSSDALSSLSELEPIGSSWDSNKASIGREPSLMMTPDRVGPLSYRGGTVHAATVAFEQYHIMMSENDANRWRSASHGSLAEIRRAADKAAERSYHRERSLKEMQRRANEIEGRLAYCKAESKRRWQLVYEAEELVVKIMEESMLQRSRERERQRMEQFRIDQEAHANDTTKAHLGATQAEVWDMIAAVTDSLEDGSFTPLDLPQAPIKGPRDQTMQSPMKPAVVPSSSPTPEMQGFSVSFASRAQIEQECNLPGLRSSALAADEAIEDTAGSLLNVLSNLDTTRRSARVAAETCLLSACNAQAACLKALVKTERESIEERLQNLVELEYIVENMNVRTDLDVYISNDKKERGGSTWMGDDDDGGIASALAVLSSHVDGSMGNTSPNRMTALDWNDTDEDEGDITPEELEDAVEDLFFDEETLTIRTDDAFAEFEKSVSFLCKVAEDRKHPCSRSRRSTICYAINSKRSATRLKRQMQFDGVSRVIYSILNGCDHEAGSVANAKMCMMLSQSFFIVDEENSESESKTENESPNRSARNKRIYVKSKLAEHPIWADEEFWDQALFQCVTESLTHSGVMSNFERGGDSANRSEWTETRKLKWHDLTHTERCEAASQVHAVVFAQLGALAHSMIEFGCGLERSCAFVRRMSVRNQLPISQRTMLLQHLLGEQAASPTKLAVSPQS